MVRTHRFLTTTVVLVCFVMAQSRGALAADEQPPLPSTSLPLTLSIDAVVGREDVTSAIDVAAGDQPLDREEPLRIAERPRLTLPDEIFRERLSAGIAGAHVWRGIPTFHPDDAGSLAQRRGYRGRGSGRNDGARAAIFLGAVGVIAGTAVLVYTNRPECSVSARANGCGYGTKVAGGAVLSAGLVGLLIGALTWR